MSYSVGKAVRELNNKNDNIYYLSGDDYFLQKFFITSLEKTYILSEKQDGIRISVDASSYYSAPSKPVGPGPRSVTGATQRLA